MAIVFGSRNGLIGRSFFRHLLVPVSNRFPSVILPRFAGITKG
jgi:hypothetical protein